MGGRDGSVHVYNLISPGDQAADSQVSGTVPELVGGEEQLTSVGREDGSGEGVLGGGIDGLADLLVLGVLVNVTLKRVRDESLSARCATGRDSTVRT